MSNTIKFLGITDERDSCDCCGKKNLKRTVALTVDDGPVVFYGTTCASVAFGLPAKSVLSEAKAATRAREEADRKVRAERAAKESSALRLILVQELTARGISVPYDFSGKLDVLLCNEALRNAGVDVAELWARSRASVA